mgnify:CR=1 FL=1
MSAVDGLGRPLRTLRISVTDRCNLRCTYCDTEYAFYEGTKRSIDDVVAAGAGR